MLTLWDTSARKLLATKVSEHTGTVGAALLTRKAHMGQPGHHDEYFLATGGTEGTIQWFNVRVDRSPVGAADSTLAVLTALNQLRQDRRVADPPAAGPPLEAIATSALSSHVLDLFRMLRQCFNKDALVVSPASGNAVSSPYLVGVSGMYVPGSAVSSVTRCSATILDFYVSQPSWHTQCSSS